MSIDNVNGSGSDLDHERAECEMEHNPNGPWANLQDQRVQDAILRLAGKYHAACAADNPRLSKFPDFLDAFATAWLMQKADVEQEAQRYGFIPCESITDIPEKDRHNAAILSLTLNGSFVLLGNGCLSYQGGSGRYEKIPLRKAGRPTRQRAPSGVIVEEAALQRRLRVKSERYPFIGGTSPLQALYYTNNVLGGDDELKLEQVVSGSVKRFSESVRNGCSETMQGVPRNTPDLHPEQPEAVPKSPIPLLC